MSERCELTDLLPDQCSCGRHRGGANEPEPTRDVGGHVFEAKFPGRCRECGEDIEPGDRITAGRGGYIHEECS